MVIIGDVASIATAVGVAIIDLSNEQAFLRLRRRVRRSTWRDWLDGIETNFRKPAFQRAWAEIASRAPASFEELRRIVPPSPAGQIRAFGRTRREVLALLFRNPEQRLFCGRSSAPSRPAPGPSSASSAIGSPLAW